MIQKKIFTFWDNEKIPKICKVCFDSWKLHCPEFEIQMLHLNNFQDYIERPIPNGFNKLKIQGKSDWIRCALIYENGGIWMDTSILLTQNINNWFKSDCDFLGIRNEKRIENWLFAAPKNSLIVLEWIKQHEYAISIGPEQYEKDTMKLVDWDNWTYLYHQLCFLRACQLLSIDMLDKSNPSYCIRDVSELGFPKLDSKYNFRSWYLEFTYNAVRLGIKKENILALYKIVSFSRKWAEKALQSKIQKGSPLYLAGYRNNYRNNLKIYYSSFFMRYSKKKIIILFLLLLCIYFFLKKIDQF